MKTPHPAPEQADYRRCRCHRFRDRADMRTSNKEDMMSEAPLVRPAWPIDVRAGGLFAFDHFGELMAAAHCDLRDGGHVPSTPWDSSRIGLCRSGRCSPPCSSWRTSTGSLVLSVYYGAQDVGVERGLVSGRACHSDGVECRRAGGQHRPGRPHERESPPHQATRVTQRATGIGAGSPLPAVAS